MADSKRWADLGEEGFVLGMRLLFAAYRCGGSIVFRIVLQPVLLFYFIRGKIARRASLQYLQRLQQYFQDPNLPAPTLWNAYRHFNAFASSSMDRLALWANTRILDDLRFENRPLLLKQLASGQGAILLGAHLGNMEVCRGLSTRNPDLRLNILVHTEHADKFNRLLEEVVGTNAIRLIEVNDITPATAIALKQRVDDGEFVAIMADRVPVRSSQRCSEHEFLGHKALFAHGPYILASLLKCPVYTLFGVKRDGHYSINCQTFAEQIVLPRQSKAQALKTYTERYVRVLESELRKHPLQWFNFYPYWDQH